MVKVYVLSQSCKTSVSSWVSTDLVNGSSWSQNSVGRVCLLSWSCFEKFVSRFGVQTVPVMSRSWDTKLLSRSQHWLSVCFCDMKWNPFTCLIIDMNVSSSSFVRSLFVVCTCRVLTKKTVCNHPLLKELHVGQSRCPSQQERIEILPTVEVLAGRKRLEKSHDCHWKVHSLQLLRFSNRSCFVVLTVQIVLTFHSH